MNKKDVDLLAQYYQSELSYLRNSGMEFAQKYPKIAGKLDISKSASADPNVERLLESFAFLTGKLQKQIHDQFPEISLFLLSLTYPPLIAPTPSVAMVHFNVDLKRAKKAPNTIIPKNTNLFSKSQEKNSIECTFRTAHKVSLWPIEILKHEIVSRDDLFTSDNPITNINKSSFYLKLSFKWHGIDPNIQPDKLRIYINGNHTFKGNLFSSLFLSSNQTIMNQAGNFHLSSPISNIGINEDESLFPYPNSVFKGFRLLHEYFAFPDKFYGFDIIFPSDFILKDIFEVCIPIENYIQIPDDGNVFMLHSVPAVNLFNKITDPLHLTYQDTSYKLVPDVIRNKFTEIYSINSVIQIDKITNKQEEISPFFSCRHNEMDNDNKIKYYTKRKKTYSHECFGDDIEIYFVDNNFDPTYPSDKIFYANTLCTNRHMAQLMPAYSALQIESTLPVKNIYCLDRPTAQKGSISEGGALWKIISILSLNSVSFSNDGIKKLKEMLLAFSANLSPEMMNEINSIVSINSSKSVKLYKDSAWRGFIRGTSINIEFDDSISNKGIPLSYILSNLFSVYTSINTFTELTCISNKVSKTWPMNIGLHNYL